nr:hypothetical protein [Streptomyces sp. HB202]
MLFQNGCGLVGLLVDGVLGLVHDGGELVEAAVLADRATPLGASGLVQGLLLVELAFRFSVAAGCPVELVELDRQVGGHVDGPRCVAAGAAVVVRVESVGEQAFDVAEDLCLDLLGDDLGDLLDGVVDGFVQRDPACGDREGADGGARAEGEEHADHAGGGGAGGDAQVGDAGDLAAFDEPGAVVEGVGQAVEGTGKGFEVLGGQFAPAPVDRPDRLALALAGDDV